MVDLSPSFMYQHVGNKVLVQRDTFNIYSEADDWFDQAT